MKISLKKLIFFPLLALAFTSNAQEELKDWFHKDYKVDGYYGASVNEAYKLLKGKKSVPVIVAVIDGGVQVDHEDLKNVLWTNKGEIPNDGIDNDKNGYIDDIHGWNFCGNAKGEDYNDETLEVTRTVARLKDKFEGKPASSFSGKDLKSYKNYMRAKEELDNSLSEAQANLGNMEQTKTMILGAIDAMRKALDGKKPTLENINAIEVGDDLVLATAKDVFNRVYDQGEEIEDLDSFQQEFLDQLKGGIDYYSNQVNSYYNVDFSGRSIVGDDYDNADDIYYGNNHYEGPDGLHGTHVAGIIGAERNNNVGMNGVANNVQIMSVRCVPNGDEHDKDVATSIRYAVDNGAKVINMSFGKSFGYDKEAVDAAVRYAKKHDVLMIHAAGNDGSDVDEKERYPSPIYNKGGFFKPKKAKHHWIEVGALSYGKGNKRVATFSNYGDDIVDLFAPGTKIYSTIPHNEYRFLQGTSMASPVVAGVACIIRSYFPQLSAKEVKKILLKSATRINETVNLPGSDKSVKFSTLSITGGTVNAAEAVKLALKKQ